MSPIILSEIVKFTYWSCKVVEISHFGLLVWCIIFYSTWLFRCSCCGSIRGLTCVFERLDTSDVGYSCPRWNVIVVIELIPLLHMWVELNFFNKIKSYSETRGRECTNKMKTSKSELTRNVRPLHPIIKKKFTNSNDLSLNNLIYEAWWTSGMILGLRRGYISFSHMKNMRIFPIFGDPKIMLC